MWRRSLPHAWVIGCWEFDFEKCELLIFCYEKIKNLLMSTYCFCRCSSQTLFPYQTAPWLRDHNTMNKDIIIYVQTKPNLLLENRTHTDPEEHQPSSGHASFVLKFQTGILCFTFGLKAWEVLIKNYYLSWFLSTIHSCILYLYDIILQLISFYLTSSILY